MQSNSDIDLEKIFQNVTTIAVVGLSDKPERSSFGVAELLTGDFTIVPVNPMLENWLGRPAYADIESAAKDHKIDIVNIFRKSEEILPIIQQVLRLPEDQRPGCIWMQQGVINEQAAQLAQAAGITVVMDACIAVLYRQWLGNKG